MMARFIRGSTPMISPRARGVSQGRARRRARPWLTPRARGLIIGVEPRMKRAIITVGLGFGDEGKGATVDYLTRHFGADLVVRYCGGSQAGHNVQLPDGRRHTFSQFGAGTLAGASGRPRTYLGPGV